MSRAEACTQPECSLREDDTDHHTLAEMIVQVLAGEDVAVDSPITRRERCLGCVQRVLRGGEPLPTVEKFESFLKAGKWTRRRARRRKLRESRVA